MFVTRKFQPSDIYKGFLELIDSPSSPAEAIEVLDWLQTEVLEGKRNILVIEDLDNKILIGTATLSITRTFADHGKLKGFLNDVHVLESYRKRGLGESLVQRCLDQAKDLGVTHVTLACSDRNKHWYEKFGFQYKYYHMAISLAEKV